MEEALRTTNSTTLALLLTREGNGADDPRIAIAASMIRVLARSFGVQ